MTFATQTLIPGGLHPNDQWSNHAGDSLDMSPHAATNLPDAGVRRKVGNFGDSSRRKPHLAGLSSDPLLEV